MRKVHHKESGSVVRVILDCLLLASTYFVALVILPNILKTNTRGFFCGDKSLMYPYKLNTLLKPIHIGIFVLAIPATVVLCSKLMSVINIMKDTSSSSSNFQTRYIIAGIQIPTIISDCFAILGAYLFGLALVVIVTISTQRLTGRLAPYFFEVCQPIITINSTACTHVSHFKLYIAEYTCSSFTSGIKLLSEMRHSFPSSYASTTTYAMAFIIMYLRTRFTTKHALWLQYCRLLLQCGCGMLAILVAVERLTSYRHHWSDVVFGGVIGATVACIVIHMLLSNLFERVPIKTRSHRTQANESLILQRKKVDNNFSFGYYNLGYCYNLDEVFTRPMFDGPEERTINLQKACSLRANVVQIVVKNTESNIFQ
uniref:Phosphatidic acid phosphatase type 2/haloperoxidase domain-containing protein n=1 Tax=Glossina austeni TaxID=7395 RepID=A0A1A9VHG4_GLOAU